jgi:alkanesulfonate monooxygenase SsuD/methylene tetrahydromethanopterin reductase-like flavin-dependent oxidoreductase (luciferase family)
MEHQMGKALNFGVTLGQRSVGFGAATVEDLLQLGEWVDASDEFGSLFVGDNFLAKHRLESITLLGAVAGRTKRVQLGTACMASFPLRHPIWLAYQWATLDIISNGRTILPVCIGGGSRQAGGDIEQEYEAMGLSVKTRARRLEEGIEIVRRLWTEDHVTHEGEFYQFKNLTMDPKPVQRPVPIWIVSNANVFTDDPELQNRPLKRTARLGDGWLSGASPPETIAHNWRKIRQFAAEYGRDPNSLECSLQLTVNINDDAEAAYAEMKRWMDLYYETDWSRDALENLGAWGSVEQCTEKLGRWIDVGATYITLRLTTWDLAGQFKKVNDLLLPALRGRQMRAAAEPA